MVTELNHYLDSVRDNLRLDHSSEQEVTSELETHINERLHELRQAGLSEEEAIVKLSQLTEDEIIALADDLESLQYVGRRRGHIRHHGQKRGYYVFPDPILWLAGACLVTGGLLLIEFSYY